MKFWRKLLWPFVPFYYLGALFVKKMYDWSVFKSTSYNFPVITVGNVSAGGTGKSPFVGYLVALLQNDKKVAVLSRGYGRKSKGFQLVETSSNALWVGDEPLQLKQNFPNIHVAVDADRRNGIQKLLKPSVKPEVLILDDAFQHRKVKGGFQIVLTAYYNLYVNDYSLPVGDLREPISAVARAQVIIVTKCPESLSKQEQKSIKDKLKPLPHQQLYFTTINYDNFVYGYELKIPLLEFLKEEFCLVTGIAAPKPLVDFLVNKKAKFIHKNFSDHHVFSSQEIIEISEYKKILTTQKDFMRMQYEPVLKGKLVYLPIGVTFLENELDFQQQVRNFFNNY